ncbi:MAG: type 2 isopentenyl-diphosphate Delta-isomerase [Candidatus Micrarchaeota archaeon]|nr:type 2 isopentenyl-diphosphate Delta-isomerase [Candidatus Micrarchaeota archaeon]
MSVQTKKRKGEHVRICVSKDVQHEYNWLDDVEFVHKALTTLDYGALDTRAVFLRHRLKLPFMITGMTGGYQEARKINRALAAACEKYGIAFGLGSQRAMIENPALTETYRVRDVAPTIPIVGNIGAAQLLKYESEQINDMLKSVEADYLAVHLNTLQELVQPEGDREFAGIRERIESVAREIEYPIIIKETGAGIGWETARMFNGIFSKVAGFDVAGRGGTSWSKVEELRGGDAGPFSEWGNPTPVCIAEVSELGAFTIASGGIRNGLDAAKAIALGADIAGAACPFMRAYYKKRLDETIAQWETYLKRAMLLTNSRNIEELGQASIIITGRTAEYMLAKGINIQEYAQR